MLQFLVFFSQAFEGWKRAQLPSHLGFSSVHIVLLELLTHDEHAISADTVASLLHIVKVKPLGSALRQRVEHKTVCKLAVGFNLMGLPGHFLEP